MSISLSKIYNRVCHLSPIVEVAARMIYWRNVSKASGLSNNKNRRIQHAEEVDFNDVIDFLKQNGIGKGSLVIYHSSYGNIKPCNKDVKGVVDSLLTLVGDEGTLAAPVIRSYADDNRSLSEKFLNSKPIPVCTYDVRNTKITSGILAATLMAHEGSVTSLHPLNPLTAVGPLAQPMMAHNLDGDAPSAHGPNSCWKFCFDHDAYIVYLGCDFGHHITMQQIIAECNPTWNVKDFFWKRKFVIKDGDSVIEKEVSERTYFWSQYLAELNTRENLIKAGVAKYTTINGMPLCVMRSKDLISFMTSQRKYYPYLFIDGKHLDKKIKYRKDAL